MDKAKKLYAKALNKYQSGYIEEAIALCEEVMSLSMKNNAAINLKGLLLYFKGDLEGARALWKLNYEVNNDEVARRYLQSLKEDEKNFSLYTSAVSLINAFNIKEALDILAKCKESDYNSINVNNAMATCYITMGQYEEAVYYINKVLEIDRKNEIANSNRKNLVKSRVSKKRFIHNNTINKGFAVVIVLFFIAGFSMFGIKELMYNKIEPKQAKEPINISQGQGIKEDNTAINKTEYKKEEAEATKNQANIDQKTVENSNAVKPTLSEEELKDLYIKGKEEINTGQNYDEAIAYLLKAYNNSNSNYLYPHIIYNLGFAYESKKDVNEAVKYYSEYITKFPKESYVEEVLYRLVLINKDTDTSKAKEYAHKLSTTYPESQYNNSIVKNILSR